MKPSIPGYSEADSVHLFNGELAVREELQNFTLSLDSIERFA
jgi:hypothetical protein